jgi:hypothetical protein
MRADDAERGIVLVRVATRSPDLSPLNRILIELLRHCASTDTVGVRAGYQLKSVSTAHGSTKGDRNEPSTLSVGSALSSYRGRGVQRPSDGSWRLRRGRLRWRWRAERWERVGSRCERKRIHTQRLDEPTKRNCSEQRGRDERAEPGEWRRR